MGPKCWPLAFSCLGTVEGEIWPEPRGTNGFGYDPIFFYPPYAATFGEVDDARKLEVAHRGVARNARGVAKRLLRGPTQWLKALTRATRSPALSLSKGYRSLSSF